MKQDKQKENFHSGWRLKLTQASDAPSRWYVTIASVTATLQFANGATSVARANKQSFIVIGAFSEAFSQQIEHRIALFFSFVSLRLGGKTSASILHASIILSLFSLLRNVCTTTELVQCSSWKTEWLVYWRLDEALKWITGIVLRLNGDKRGFNWIGTQDQTTLLPHYDDYFYDSKKIVKGWNWI
jgi:hypothetical protein